MKRHTSLQPISREHHYALLLSWKIREGIKRKVIPERMKEYTDWFWENYLEAHFDFEEKYIFPVLGEKHRLVKRALREHRRLKRLFTSMDRVDLKLSLIEEELVSHIRYEERVLFPEVEKKASEVQLEEIEKANNKMLIVDDWQDEFWVDL